MTSVGHSGTRLRPMFNLLVGHTGDTADASRMLEYTSDAVKAYVAPTGTPDPLRLMQLPTLVMPETQAVVDQVARIGRIDHLSLSGRTWRFRFTPTPGLQSIPTEHIEAEAGPLGIGDWEFNRTHWAVKEGDLYGVLFGRLAPAISPRVFTLPTSVPEPDLVAVMMPFAGFDAVYDALKSAAAAADMRCQCADDIWEDDAIMTDVVSLIWRSSVVISDLTGRNANVFYETGIAHTLGRDLIQITQAAADVPFDLQSLRYVKYLPNGEGLQALQAAVTSRLRTLLAARSTRRPGGQSAPTG